MSASPVKENNKYVYLSQRAGFDKDWSVLQYNPVVLSV